MDYDIRVANMYNPGQDQQFKAIVAFFNVHGLEIGNTDTTKRLLGQHFELKTMQTARKLEKSNMLNESALQKIQEADRENEQEELGVENLADEESRLEEDPFGDDEAGENEEEEK